MEDGHSRPPISRQPSSSYTFAVPRFGGRIWTAVSASLLLIPTLLLAFAVPSGWLPEQSPET